MQSIPIYQLALPARQCAEPASTRTAAGCISEPTSRRVVDAVLISDKYHRAVTFPGAVLKFARAGQDEMRIQNTQCDNCLIGCMVASQARPSAGSCTSMRTPVLLAECCQQHTPYLAAFCGCTFALQGSFNWLRLDGAVLLRRPKCQQVVVITQSSQERAREKTCGRLAVFHSFLLDCLSRWLSFAPNPACLQKSKFGHCQVLVSSSVQCHPCLRSYRGGCSAFPASQLHIKTLRPAIPD